MSAADVIRDLERDMRAVCDFDRAFSQPGGPAMLAALVKQYPGTRRIAELWAEARTNHHDVT